MTPEQIFLGLFFFVIIALFLSGKFSVDLVALCGLLTLTLLGFVESKVAFSGFASSAVLTLIATFILGGALSRTGVAEGVAIRIQRAAGKSLRATIALVMLLAASLSAFMSNVATAAVLLPAIVSLAHRSSIRPSKLLMPLAFGTVLGGMCTVIGTPPNILMAEYVSEHSMKAFSFFAFADFGVPALLLGILFVAVFSPILLPERGVSSKRKQRRKDLAKLYQLEDRLVSLRVPKGSRLSGQTLAQARIGELIDAQVVLILRENGKVFAPGPNEIIEVEDLLVLRARPASIEQALRLSALPFFPIDAPKLQRFRSQMNFQVFEVQGAPAAGESLKEMGLRRNYQLALAGVLRREKFIGTLGADFLLQRGDKLLLIGELSDCDKLESDWGLLKLSEVSGFDRFFESAFFQASVSEGSPLVGVTLRKSHFGEVAGLNIVGLLRGEELLSGANADVEIEEGDVLVATGEGKVFQQLAAISRLELEEVESLEAKLDSSDFIFVEAVLAPRSGLIGETLKDISFRERYGFQVVAIWRAGKPVRHRVAKDALQFGDALLLQGPRSKLPILARDTDFVVLSDSFRPKQKRSAVLAAIFGFLLMTVLSVFRIQPVHVAAFSGAAVAILGGAIRINDAYKEVEWRIVFLIACLIPLGGAVESSGLAGLVADFMIANASVLGSIGLIIAFSLFASLLSQTLDGSVAVILLAPLVAELSKTGLLGIPTETVLMLVALSASVAFLTPFSHKANLLVMGAGSYRTGDYFRIGAPLSAIVFATMWAIAFWLG